MSNYNIYRKCAKCGKTRAEDMTVSYHRFPNPGIANMTRASAWAKYCYPTEEWTSLEFLQSLYRKNKVICGRHFHASKFYDNMRQKLCKFAVPDSDDVEELLINRENIFMQTDETEGISKDVVQNTKADHSDHSYTRKKEPPPPIQPTLFNLRPKIDLATAAISTDTVTQLSQSADESDDIASADQIEENPEPLFSWQAPCQLSVEDEGCDELPSVVTNTNEQNLPKKKDSEDPIEIDGLEDADNKNDTVPMPKEEEVVEYKSEKHIGYSCDHCMGEIIGFRYKCVQCENYDLCRACESRLVHAHHYVLRLPRPTPCNEVKIMIEAISKRIKILNKEINEATDSMVLEDIKEEAPFEEVQVDPFEALEAIDTVPDMPSQVAKGSEEAEDRLEEKSTETRSMFKEWDLESETTESATSDLDLETIDDTTKGSRKRKLSSTEKSQERTWREEIELTTQEDITHEENVEIEWLDESILESEVNQNRNDMNKMSIENEDVEWLDESISETGDMKHNCNDHKRKSPLESDKVKKAQNDGLENIRSDLEFNSKQVLRKSKRKDVQKTKVDPEESEVKKLHSDRKRVNILSKSSKVNRLNS